MKTIEEKARAYDAMVQRVKELYESGNALTKRQMEIIYPELAESEDERIRTFLHHTFTAQYLCKDKTGKWHGEPVINILAYLEKQKEQKLSVADAMKSLDEKIEKAKKTWKGVDVDKYMAEVRGEQKPIDEKIVDEIGKGVRKKLALDFIHYLDANCYEGKMCVSNGECEISHRNRIQLNILN